MNNKPISVMIHDARVEIIDAINRQNLHPAILLPIIESIYMDVSKTAEVQYKNEKKEYEKSLEKESQVINENVESE